MPRVAARRAPRATACPVPLRTRRRRRLFRRRRVARASSRLASRDDTASAPRRWSRGEGGAPADAEVLEVTRKRGDCYGCGVALQTDLPSVSTRPSRRVRDQGATPAAGRHDALRSVFRAVARADGQCRRGPGRRAPADGPHHPRAAPRAALRDPREEGAGGEGGGRHRLPRVVPEQGRDRGGQPHHARAHEGGPVAERHEPRVVARVGDARSGDCSATDPRRRRLRLRAQRARR